MEMVKVVEHLLKTQLNSILNMKTHNHKLDDLQRKL